MRQSEIWLQPNETWVQSHGTIYISLFWSGIEPLEITIGRHRSGMGLYGSEIITIKIKCLKFTYFNFQQHLHIIKLIN